VPIAALWAPWGAGWPGEERVLALLSEEPVGRISTRNAGAVSFWAKLSWHPDDGIPAGSILGEPTPSARFYSFVQTEDVASATRRISCEIRAFHTEELAGALDVALRSLTEYAALTEAVFETHAVRFADPSVAPATLVEELARQLRGAGYQVSFGPSWVPVPGVTDIAVGVRGLEDAFEAFLRACLTRQPPLRLSALLDERRRGQG
jgi:hypothetical protein